MFKIYLKLILFICIVLTPGIILSQHHLYFSIPECPNSVNILDIRKDIFTITPNPACDFLKITFSSEIDDNSKIRIIDLSGKAVYDKEIHNKDLENKVLLLDISKFEQGLYYVQITDKKRVFSEKFIITQ